MKKIIKVKSTPEFQAYHAAKIRTHRTGEPFLFTSFRQFYSSLGPRPAGSKNGKSLYKLGRIEKNLGFSPDNCEWQLAQAKVKLPKIRVLKTHCPNGHEYTTENTKLTKRGRECRKCEQASERRARIRKTTRLGKVFRPNPKQAPTKECHVCGKPVPEGKIRYCSDDCYQLRRRAIRRMVYRARKYGAPFIELVDPYTVFERDDYTCQICHGATWREYRGTNHPLAPECGHLVPLNWGGDHSYDNCRTEHRFCNALKSRHGEDMGKKSVAIRTVAYEALKVALAAA